MLPASDIMKWFCSMSLLLLLLHHELQCAAASRLAHFSYVGCYIDSDTRDMTGLRGINQFGKYQVTSYYGFEDLTRLTLQMCSAVCSLGGFPYFGVQAGYACFCGFTVGSLGKAALESDCNSPCRGNSSQICGGGYKNSVYSQIYPKDNGCSTFHIEQRAPLTVSSSFTQPTYSTMKSADVLSCTLSCNSTCQAVIFSQQQQLCHLLRFALVPEALNATAGDFFVRR